MLETITTTWSNWRENVIQPKRTQPKVYYFIQIFIDVMILIVIQIIYQGRQQSVQSGDSWMTQSNNVSMELALSCPQIVNKPSSNLTSHHDHRGNSTWAYYFLLDCHRFHSLIISRHCLLMEAQCVDHQPGLVGRRLSLKKVGQPNSSCLVVIWFERLIQRTVNNVRHSSASSAIAD
jgi:hypothetical protein